MTGFDKVLVMLQYEFHLAVGKGALANEVEDTFGDRNLFRQLRLMYIALFAGY